jgi:hypothetical protein
MAVCSGVHSSYQLNCNFHLNTKGNRDVNKLRFTSELAPGRDGALVDVFWDTKCVPFTKWVEVGDRPVRSSRPVGVNKFWLEA